MAVRLFALAVVLFVVPIGLIARSQRSEADSSSLAGFLASYTGDTLWPIMFYFAGVFCFPRASITKLATLVLVLTLGLEFGQLWQPDWLQMLRAQPGIGFVLGNSFVWSDVWCLLVGTGLAVAFHLLLLRPLDHEVVRSHASVTDLDRRTAFWA